eukprot:6199577-Pleurochrysis_carterae.AAC.1
MPSFPPPRATPALLGPHARERTHTSRRRAVASTYTAAVNDVSDHRERRCARMRGAGASPGPRSSGLLSRYHTLTLARVPRTPWSRPRHARRPAWCRHQHNIRGLPGPSDCLCPCDASPLTNGTAIQTRANLKFVARPVRAADDVCAELLRYAQALEELNRHAAMLPAAR